MKHICETIAIGLVTIILFSAGSCTQTTIESDTAKPAGSIAPAETKDRFDVLPSADYDGYTFKAADISGGTPDPVSIIFDVEEQTGESVYDAIYLRNRRIESKYNIQT